MATDSARWYFAYGSNLCASIFVERRGIKPLLSEPVAVNSHTLAFNVLFVPYTDPVMAGLEEITDGEGVPVHGTAYLLSENDFRKMIISEGAGVAYNTINLTAKSLRGGRILEVTTLTARRRFRPGIERFPSPRYMGLIVRGAQEQNLPQSYQIYLSNLKTFQESETMVWRAGKTCFNAFWNPISTMVAKGTRKFNDGNGHAPFWFMILFDVLLHMMWIQHDFLFAPLFGRGDGR